MPERRPLKKISQCQLEYLFGYKKWGDFYGSEMKNWKRQTYYKYRVIYM